MLISNSETFLSEMSKLFATNQSSGGSIYITMKRIDDSKKPAPRSLEKQLKRLSMRPGKKTKQHKLQEQQLQQQLQKQQQQQQLQQQAESSSSTAEHMCLIRVHDKSRKISTVVSAKEVNKFQQAYSNLLRGNLYGLKKKEKKKSDKKSKATQ